MNNINIDKKCGTLHGKYNFTEPERETLEINNGYMTVNILNSAEIWSDYEKRVNY